MAVSIQRQIVLSGLGNLGNGNRRLIGLLWTVQTELKAGHDGGQFC
jgi:hypothetical protein